MAHLMGMAGAIFPRCVGRVLGILQELDLPAESLKEVRHFMVPTLCSSLYNALNMIERTIRTTLESFLAPC